MSALHWYTRNGKTWTDQPECVSPVVRYLCIRLNDTLGSDAEREEVIGPHLFAPVGTRTNEDDEKRRLALCVDRAIRVFAPYWMRKTGNEELITHSERLENLPAITTHEQAQSALDMVEAARRAARKVGAAYAAVSCAVASVSASSAYAVVAYSYASAAATVVVSAASYAYAADYATASEADRAWFRREVMRLILDCCAVGRQEVDTTKTREEVMEFLNR
jgi:hypothetical protein